MVAATFLPGSCSTLVMSLPFGATREATDSRAGLDENAKRDVYVIMKRRGVTFDEARRIYVEGVFGREGIGADGRPLDRKAVMFS